MIILIIYNICAKFIAQLIFINYNFLIKKKNSFFSKIMVKFQPELILNASKKNDGNKDGLLNK